MDKNLVTTQSNLIQSLRGLKIKKYNPVLLGKYLDFLEQTGLTLDTGLLPYVEDLKENGWTDRQGKQRKYKAESVIACLNAAKALGTYVIEKWPDLLTPEQYMAYDQAKKAATKACPKKDKGVGSEKYLTWKEVAKLIQGTEDMKMKLIMMVLATTGIRISEALDIKLSDMKKNKICYHIYVVGKGNKEGYVNVRCPIIEACLKTFKGKTWLFEHDGKQYNPRSITTRIGDISEKVIGRRISAHVFRHSWATEQQEKGMPIEQISKYLRHSSISTTVDFYAHKEPSPEAAMLDLPLETGLVPADPEDEKKVTEALDKALKHLSE